MSDAQEALTALVLETFRLNGRLLAAGDALVAGTGLTSARWQVLGAILFAGRPLPVPRIAEAMGLTRQAVQRQVNEMAAAGLLDFAPNPHHKRARLVVVTDAGRAAYAAADALQRPWAARLAEALGPGEAEAAAEVLRRLRAALEAQE
ncbi:MarR family winged helix-turn-helix transcriptional regulator [Oceanicella sp. SM1341]|uniref:MarR family winged helix-turn-helix transcriptional regulator n=1 Tax=Oceanicella sp. SM1341 TaxID=1548889 RepID=UPI000E54C365|nr:helix-turn-helix domain-containing protein [Oceanicella sp. SM1341]